MKPVQDVPFLPLLLHLSLCWCYGGESRNTRSMAASCRHVVGATHKHLAAQSEKERFRRSSRGWGQGQSVIVVVIWFPCFEHHTSLTKRAERRIIWKGCRQNQRSSVGHLVSPLKDDKVSRTAAIFPPFSVLQLIASESSPKGVHPIRH